MNTTLILILIVVNVPIYWLLARAFFGGWEGFLQSLEAIINPDIVSALSGNYEEHRIGRFTLAMFVVVCVVTTAAEYHVIAKFFLGMERPWG